VQEDAVGEHREHGRVSDRCGAAVGVVRGDGRLLGQFADVVHRQGDPVVAGMKDRLLDRDRDDVAGLVGGHDAGGDRVAVITARGRLLRVAQSVLFGEGGGRLQHEVRLRSGWPQPNQAEHCDPEDMT